MCILTAHNEAEIPSWASGVITEPGWNYSFNLCTMGDTLFITMH